MFGKGAPRCRRCSGAVYAAEEVIGAGQKWHNDCFSCLTCKTRLSSTTLTEKDGEIYCATCYAKQWGPKGFGIGSQSLTYTGVSVADPSGTTAPSRPAASPASSPASAGAGAGSKGCFCTNCGAGGQTGKFCGSCGKPVSAPSASSSSAASPAPSPVAAAPAAPAPVSSPPASRFGLPGARPAAFVPSPAAKCGACLQTVFEAEKVSGGGRVWHAACFRCATCRAGLSSTTINDKDGKIYCNACYGKNFGPKGYGFSGGGAGLMSS